MDALVGFAGVVLGWLLAAGTQTWRESLAARDAARMIEAELAANVWHVRHPEKPWTIQRGAWEAYGIAAIRLVRGYGDAALLIAAYGHLEEALGLVGREDAESKTQLEEHVEHVWRAVETLREISAISTLRLLVPGLRRVRFHPRPGA
jgi:hypothetical protein